MKLTGQIFFATVTLVLALNFQSASASGLFGVVYEQKADVVLTVNGRTYDCLQFLIGANNWEIRSFFCDSRIIHIKVKYPQGMEDSFTVDSVTNPSVQVRK